MPCLKIMSDPYDNPSSLPNTVNYVFKGAKIYGGGAVNPINAVEEMQLVKQLWLQTEGRQVHHFILCLTPKESKAICCAEQLLDVAYDICKFYQSEFQIIFGIHQGDSDLWHIHFIVNTVNFRTGKKLSTSNAHDIELLKYIKQILKYDKIPIHY